MSIKVLGLVSLLMASPGPTGTPAAPWTLADLSARASAQGPAAQAALSQAQALRASTAGTQALAPTNPQVSLSVGPHWSAPPHPELALYGRLAWPLEISGARLAKSAAAQANLEAATAVTAWGRQLAVQQALEAAIEVFAARAQQELVHERVAVHTDLLRVAEARLQAGTVGAEDVALAHVVLAQHTAEAMRRQGAADNAWLLLLRALGEPLATAARPLTLTFGDPAPTAGEAVAQALRNRQDLHGLQAGQKAAEALWTAAGREAVPVPLFTAQGGRTPEKFWELGAESQLPVYQRNQGGRAKALAERDGRRLEAAQRAVDVQVQAQSAYGRWAAEVAALNLLQQSSAQLQRVEMLSERAYALGRDTLGQALLRRREAQSARQALLDASVQVLRARLALACATGEMP
jgi:cobalt-zinc-cadmium efflux system outer membrane protein